MKIRTLPLIPLAFVLPPSAFGAVLTANGPVTPVTAVNLTEAGTTTWAAWNRSGTAVSSAAANYLMSGGTGTFSSITTTNSANVQGTSNLTTYPANVFTWTNALGNTAPPEKLSGVFHSSLDQTTNGIKLTLTGLPALTDGQLYQINVYGSSFDGTGTVTLRLGELFANLSTNSHGVGNESKGTDLMSFHYNPDSPTDILSFEMFLTTDLTSNSSSHALIQAIAVSVIPEPSAGLLSLAGGLFILRRKRRTI